MACPISADVIQVPDTLSRHLHLPRSAFDEREISVVSGDQHNTTIGIQTVLDH